ncbi:MAG: hypothetical protein JJE45_00465 [Prolixibacteraceae bacterium]|nr:hypothetical protein [Prolixibacteraceae bacterium]
MKTEFNITKWTTIETTLEKKLSKKKRKICKLFNIPIPPRRAFVTAEIEHDAGKALVMNDGILFPLCEEGVVYIITTPPQEGKCKVSSNRAMWKYSEYTGPAIIIFHAFSERAGMGEPTHIPR